MTWKDDRNLGPWDFIEQPDKWGYLNNPRWVPTPTAPVNYTGRVLSEPQIWTPNNKLYPDGGSDEHRPCGHWHKRGGIPGGPMILDMGFFQQSIDVHHGRIAMCAMLVDDPYGITCVEYVDGEWYALGTVGNLSQYMTPNTLRISSETGYIAYFASYYMYDWAVDTNYIGILRFARDDLPRRITAWESNIDGFPFKCGDSHIYNMMDCYGSRLCCGAYILEVEGVIHRYYQLAVSEDSGMSFTKYWEFPDGVSHIVVGGYFDRINIRMSQDGTVWIAYCRSSGAAGTHNIELWKSNPTATDWTKIWERNFYVPDLNSSEVIGFVFDIEDEAGERMAIRLMGFDGATYRHVTYYSTDFGVTFNAYLDSYIWAVAPYMKGTANGLFVVHGSNDDVNFYRSVDGGDNYGSVNPGVGLSGAWIDQQKHHAEIVYNECGLSFGGNPDKIDLLYSDDNGATWSIIESPFYQMAGPELDREVPYFPAAPNIEYTYEVNPPAEGGGYIIYNPVTKTQIINTAPGLFNDPNRDIRWTVLTL